MHDLARSRNTHVVLKSSSWIPVSAPQRVRWWFCEWITSRTRKILLRQWRSVRWRMGK